MKIDNKSIIFCIVIVLIALIFNGHVQLDIETNLILAIGLVILFFVVIPEDMISFIKESTILSKLTQKKMRFNKILSKEPPNSAIAQVIIKNKTYIYFAVSSDITYEFPEDYNMVICNSMDIVNEKLPIRRLTPTLELGIYDKSRFAEKYINCCERKILAYIIKDFGNKYDFKDIEVLLFTKLEPCLYCYCEMKDLMNKGLNLTLCYYEMLETIKKRNEKEDLDLINNIEEIEKLYTESLKNIKEMKVKKN